MERKHSNSLLVEDITPPHNLPLSGKFARSFAYTTIRDRLPVILTKVIDSLSRDKEDIVVNCGEEGKEDVKKVIGLLSQLKNEMITNKSFSLLSCGVDASIWNNYLEEKSQNASAVSWFHTEWLYAECYLYRRIKEAFLTRCTLKDYDPFHKQKMKVMEESLNSVDLLTNYLIKLMESNNQTKEVMDLAFQRMLKHSLWANKMDLSLSSGNHVEIMSDPLKIVDELESFILVDQSKEVITELVNCAKVKDLVIDIVLDNAGLELMTDLCLAEYLTTVHGAARVRFHGKTIPWFVSDVMRSDFNATITRLATHTSACQRLATCWQRYLDEGKWSFHDEIFWTLPFGFSEMKARDSELYSTLSESSLIIFKGDLNYRKLLGDINWEYSTPFHKALQGFNPAPLVAIRTAKADLIAGLSQDVYESIATKHKDWLISGEFGLIQFDGTNSKAKTANSYCI